MIKITANTPDELATLFREVARLRGSNRGYLLHEIMKEELRRFSAVHSEVWDHRLAEKPELKEVWNKYLPVLNIR